MHHPFDLIEPCIHRRVFGLQFLDLCILPLELELLLFESIDEDDAQAVILHAFDLSGGVVSHEQRADSLDILRAKADIFHAAVFPVEGNRLQAIDEIQSVAKGLDVRLVAQAR